MKLNKLAAVFIAMVLCLFMASAALAINVTNRSAEMDDFSACDRAGTIEYRFTQADWNILTAYLAANNFARIRVALNGLSLPPSPRLPVLCKDIVGTATEDGLPHTNNVALDILGVEVSDLSGVADLTAYVRGLKGNQFFEIFITAIDTVSVYNFDTDPPWIKIGLYDEVDVSTAICASVVDFSGVSTLTISNEALPNTLTFSGDNEIGHFLTLAAALRGCDKTELGGCNDTTSIALCELNTSEQFSDCPEYRKCFVIEGDIPSDGDLEVVLKTNGALVGDRTQKGVYFYDHAYGEDFVPAIIKNKAGTVIVPKTAWEYLYADGKTIADPACAWEAEYVRATFTASSFSAGKMEFCVFYAVDPDQAVANTKARIWVNVAQLPCGNVASGVVTAASLEACGVENFSMYFPYVVTQDAHWQTGIAITNLGTDVAKADMEAKLTLTDSTGAKFTYTKTDFTQVVWAVMLDSILGEFSGTPAPGPAWLKVETNFSVDGYHFMTDGNFGAGTLARFSYFQ